MKNKRTTYHPFGLNRKLSRLNLVIVTAFVVIVILTSAVLSIQVASALNFSLRDLISNQAANGSSAHRISFNLSGANTFTFGEEIIVDFPADFILGGIWDVTDFTFTDSLTRTVDAVDSGPGVDTVACADGALNVGVAIDTTNNIFRVIPCGGSFTASAASAAVVFTIAGVGANGILMLNPAFPGSYIISVTDAAGDCSSGCDMAVSIIDASTVSVSVEVSSGPVCGNSVIEAGETCDDGNVVSGDGCSALCALEGAGPPPPGDVTPPVITYHCATTINRNSAVITWETNEAANSTIQCGLTAAYGLTVFNPSFVVSHSLTINDLAEGTLYHCRACSSDSPGNSTCSSDCTFTTLDETPPIISDLSCADITTTSFRVTWNTNENASSFIDYGLEVGPPYPTNAGAAELILAHSVTVSGLLPATTYHYRVRTGDASSNEALSADLTCTTSDGAIVPPVISNIRVTDISCVAPVSATVRWDTNEAADSKVDYGPVVGPPYTNLASTPADLLSHIITLTGLSTGQTYHYRVRSEDPTDLETASADNVFITPSGSPPVISGISTSDITAGSATILWSTDVSSSSLVDYGPTVAYGSDQSNVSAVLAHSLVIPGLNACTTYHYRVRSGHACATETVSVDQSFTTTALAMPVISDLEVTHIGENSARVSWTTATPTSSTVDYGPTVAYGQVSSAPGLTLNHLVVISGLLPGTTYHFRARSEDTCNQGTATDDGTFSTIPDLIPPGCVMNLVANPGSAVIRLGWTNPPDADLQGVRLVRRQGVCPAGRADGMTVYDGLENSFDDFGVVNGLNYCYGAFGYDEAGNFGCGAIASATPVGPADVVPPACSAGFTVSVGNRQITLNWSNPADRDFAGTRIVRRTDRFPVDRSDGTVIFDGAGTGWTDVGLVNGTTYYYGAFSYDLSGNNCAGVFNQGVPAAGVDLVPPVCASGLTATAGDSQVLVVWSNPADPGLSGTRIVRRDDHAPTGPADGLAVFEGIADNYFDLGLTNGRTYYYGAYTYDASRNYCLGPTTSATPEFGLPPPRLECTDTDGGIDYFVRGTTTTSAGSFLDACVNRSVLRENFCSGGDLSTTDYRCSAGYKCSSGRCLPATAVVSTSTCGNGVCERRDCRIECNLMTFDLYIVNPDGTERHMSTGAVRSEQLSPGRLRLSFDDDGLDMDYDDVVLILDTNACGSAGVTLVSRNSPLNHQVRLAVSYHGVPKLDRLVWQDSTIAPGSTTSLNVSDDPAICEGNEDELSCPVDCQAEPMEPLVEEGDTVSESDRLSATVLRYYATSARIPLLSTSGDVSVFPGMSVIISLPSTNLLQTPRTVHLNLAAGSYVMSPTGDAFEARIVTPVDLARHLFSVVIDYGDDLTETIRAGIEVVPFSRVVEEKDGKKIGVSEARVTLYSEFENGSFGLWSGDSSGQINPVVSAEGGTYDFIVPNGTYRLSVEKDGYRTKETMAFPVINGLVIRDVVLIAEPQKTADSFQNIINQVDFQTKVVVEDIKEFTNNPFIEEGAQKRVAPAAVAVATANVAVAGAATATAFPYLLYLYTLLTHPSLLFGAKKRKKWGVVYDAVTKQPVDLAIVRLINDQTGRIIRSTVTDREGRYFFMAGRGSYRMIVAKSGYVFPTAYLKNVREDVRFINLYHSETIAVSDDATIAANIPVDPLMKEKAPRRVFWEGVARRVQRSVSVLTLLALIVAVVISPTPFVILMLAVNLLMHLLFRRLAAGRQPKNWGIVYDQQTKRPIRNAIVRIFEARYNKLLETRVTDLRGRYAFLVGNNVYYVTYEKPGYQKKQVGPLDLVAVKKKEDQLVAGDIGLVSERPVSFWSGLRFRLGTALGLINKVDKAPSLNKPPLAEKIGQTGHLIVQPGDKAAKGTVSQSVVTQPGKQAVDNLGEQKTKTPWELQVLEQIQKKAIESDSPILKNDSGPKNDESAK
ncbi:hypothetical protein A2480_04645 [Candidatus Uhrbacteria bacterium RIFOXYC2_FULL_47_19]|uniref:Fibronectin type-III domain-containing protein n=1 Tax=Candidatus Uhrbacteria bacterium RIFOXYC2_FULL_47_19 TaxID=1802424 RepID=A0A1F7WF65_9BACT|nr:MAG: hypothetical protein A2480_04645 [Candidatus Uhrbacteria bacterium RIFOXYC2_FULL_47_19]HCC22374.1 hypothetical protein [Candidatus Uhrbacteria bacterium]